jgi:hypothetical protein
MNFFSKIISFFGVALLLTTTSSFSSLTEVDITQAYELAYVEEESEIETDFVNYNFSFQKTKAAGGGDDVDTHIDEPDFSADPLPESTDVLSALNYFKSLLLSQYMLALANSVHSVDLFILYSCPKDFLS